MKTKEDKQINKAINTHDDLEKIIVRLTLESGVSIVLTNEQLESIAEQKKEFEAAKWTRTLKRSKKTDYIQLSLGNCGEFTYYISVDATSPEINACITFDLESEAKTEVNYLNLAILMRSWARFHNKIDGFVPCYISNSYVPNYGITINSDKKIVVNQDSSRHIEKVIMGAHVSSEKRAEEMLAEFKTDIEQIYKITSK